MDFPYKIRDIYIHIIFRTNLYHDNIYLFMYLFIYVFIYLFIYWGWILLQQIFLLMTDARKYLFGECRPISNYWPWILPGYDRYNTSDT